MEKSPENTKPRIYVACLAAHNSGHLHGEWIEAHQEEEEVRAAITRMLKRSPISDAEEYAIHDHEGFEGACIEEYADIGRVVRIAEFISAHGELGGAVLAHFGGDLDEADQAMADRYLGEYETLADYMQAVMEESVEIPKALRYYIDWNAMAHDAALNGEVFTIELGYQAVHVFSAH
jgi:antirestriction protein